MNKLYIYGTGPFAEQITDRFEADGIKIEGYIDDDEFHSADDFNGLTVYKYSHINNSRNKAGVEIFVAIGYSKMNKIRESVCRQLLRDGFRLYSFISKNAHVSPNAHISRNVCIFEGASVGTNTIINDGVILMANVCVEHDSSIGEYSYISNSASLGGNLTIGNNSFIGLNATIKNDITIGAYSLIGQAANIIKSTEEYSVYVGNPGYRLAKNPEDSSI